MLKCSGEVSSGQWAVGSAGQWRSRRTVLVLLLTAHCLLLTVSCRRDMQDQPKAKPYRSSSFFKDGLSSRPLVEGTVARGWLRTDAEFYTGKKSKAPGTTSAQGAQLPATGGSNTSGTTAAQTAAAAYPDDTDQFPFPITPDVLTRGRERFQIFCSVCHGMTGNGDGMVFRRGFRLPAPASFHQERLRQAPVGHFFDVMTNGWGAMPSYASQIPAQDRWAIIAYIRALQLSQQGVSPSATQSPTPAATTTTAKSGGNQ